MAITITKEVKMNKTIWKYLLIAVMVPALLCTVSCSKKSVKADTAAPSVSSDAADREAKRLAEEQRLRDEAKKGTLSATEQAKYRFITDDAYFDFDSSALTTEAQSVLKQKSQWLMSNSAAQATVEGHCDERGTNAYNLALGDRRAQSAKNFLVKSGISESRLSTVSFGEEKPVDPGHDEAAWAKNRRAHFVLK
jgi:peptidoglycan-associated lipoprotein